MTHRDLANIPLLTTSFSSLWWLPSVTQISSALAICLQVGGLILIGVQVAYFLRRK